MLDRRAFTLIELLVVIAIIALLIGILLPALGHARRAGRTTVCMANQRNLAVAWQMYSDGHKDVMVAHRAANLGGGFPNQANWHEVGNGLKFRPTWIARLGLYVGQYAFVTPATDNDRQDLEGKVFTCPEASERVDERNCSYGYNYQFLGNSRQTNGRWHNWPVRQSSLALPAKMVVMGDSFGSAADFIPSERLPYENDGRSEAAVGNEGYIIDPPRLNRDGDIGTDPHRSGMEARHSRKCASAWGDGHCEIRDLFGYGYRLLPDGRYASFGPYVHDGSAEDGDTPRNNLFTGTGGDESPPDLPR